MHLAMLLHMTPVCRVAVCTAQLLSLKRVHIPQLEVLILNVILCVCFKTVSPLEFRSVNFV